MPPSSTDPLLLRACRLEKLPRPPVWMMRQAGRYLPQYRVLRAKHDFLTLCRTPALAAEVTLQPVNELGVDAAVIFSDILVLLEAMGMPLEFTEKGGPRFAQTIRTAADVENLRLDGIEEKLACVGEAIRLTAAALASRQVPVIGFAGAPFTLASYAIEGGTGRDFAATRKMMTGAPELFARLLDRLAEGAARHLRRQVEAGARAVQIFDTWGGVLPPETWVRVAAPSLRSIVRALADLSIPVILYVKGGSAHLDGMLGTGAQVLSVDWRTPLSEVRRRVGNKVALQGNLDPETLLQSPERVREATLAMLKDHPGPGLIANLGHGILPEVPVESARAFVETVKSWRSED